MKFISPTRAATQKKYTISIKDNKKTIILIIVMIGIVRYQVPVIKQINTETSSLIKTHNYRKKPHLRTAIIDELLSRVNT